MERDPSRAGATSGATSRATSATSRPRRIRDAAPDILAPIDDSAPVSGHRPAPDRRRRSIAESPEHDWTARPRPRPPGLPAGRDARPGRRRTIDRDTLAATRSRATPSRSSTTGPAGLPVVYAIPAGGFDVIVNGDHLLSWGIEPSRAPGRGDAQPRRLVGDRAPGPTRSSGERRLICSDTGDGWDAARILLPEVGRPPDAASSAAPGGSWSACPERHLLTAGALRPGDDEFAALFAEFVVEQSGGADEPIDRRVFELVDGRLVEFSRRRPDGLTRPSRSDRDRRRVATLTLDRPDALNALTVPLKVALREAFERSPPTAAVRAVDPDRGGPRVLRRPGPRASGSSPDARAARRRAARALQPARPGDARDGPAGRSRRSTASRPAPARRSRSPATSGSPPTDAPLRAGLRPDRAGAGQRRDVDAAAARRRGEGRRAGARRRPGRRRGGAARSGSSRGSCRPTSCWPRPGRSPPGWRPGAPLALALTKRALERAWDDRPRRGARDRGRAPGRRRRRRPTTPRASPPSARSGRRGSPGSD